MKVSELLRIARKRANLTQAQLAEKVGTSQPSIARWEAGERDPGFATLQRIINACGFDLSIALNETDLHDLGLALRTRDMTPGQRVENMLDWTRRLQEFVATARPSR